MSRIYSCRVMPVPSALAAGISDESDRVRQSGNRDKNGDSTIDLDHNCLLEYDRAAALETNDLA